MGDGRAEGSSAIGDRGRAAVSLPPDVNGMFSHSAQLKEKYGQKQLLQGDEKVNRR